MSSGADDFKREAREKAGSVINRKLCGWSFCLSFGAVNMTEAIAAQKNVPLRFVYDGRDVTDKVHKIVHKWTPEVQAQAEAGEWMLSAALYPPRPKPSAADVSFLCRTLLALGVPEGSQTDMKVEGRWYWIWREQ